MSSNKGLAIAALLIGLGGLGLGGYSVIACQLLSYQTPEVKQVYSDTRYGSGSKYYVESSLTEIPQLQLNITMNVGDILYLSFNCQVFVEATTVDSFVYIYFGIDGSYILHPYRRILVIANGDDFNAGATLEAIFDDIEPDNHNITVFARGNNPSSFLENMVLIGMIYS